MMATVAATMLLVVHPRPGLEISPSCPRLKWRRAAERLGSGMLSGERGAPALAECCKKSDLLQ